MADDEQHRQPPHSTSARRGRPSMTRAVPVWARKKSTGPKHNPRELMRRKTAAEINTKKVDANNRPVVSAAKPKRRQSVSRGGGHGNSLSNKSISHAVVVSPSFKSASTTKFDMSMLLKPEYLSTLRSPSTPEKCKFPPSVYKREAQVGGPKPRYEGGPMFPNQQHQSMIHQTKEEVEADSRIAAACAEQSRQAGRVLEVDPLEESLFSSEFLHLDLAKMPISAYDAPEIFEIGTIPKWLSSSENRGYSPFRTTSSGKNPEWLPCSILEFDSMKSRKFLIKFDHNGLEKRVHRLRLQFQGEDLEAVKKRLAFCKGRQQADMMHLRWRHFIDSQDPKQITGIQKRMVQHILRKSNFDLEKSSRHRTREIVRELSNIYAKDAMQVFCRQQLRLDPNWANKKQKLGLPTFPAPSPPPHFGKLQIGATINSFKQAKKFIEKRLIYSKPLSAELLQWLQNRYCDSVENKVCMFAVDKLEGRLEGTHTVALSSFDAAQQKHHENMKEYLAVRWRHVTINRVIDTLQSTYNLLEPDMNLYNGSELQALLRSFNLRLCAELAELLATSLQRLFQAFDLEHAVESLNGVKSQYDVLFDIAAVVKHGANIDAIVLAEALTAEADGEEEKEDAAIQLRMAHQLPSVSIDFSPSCADFERVVQKSITDACAAIREQASIEPRIVTLLKVSENVPLLDVDCGNTRFERVDTMVDAMRNKTIHAVQECFQSPHELVANFEQFLHVFDIDPQAFAQRQLDAFDTGMKKLPPDSALATRQKVHPAIRAVVEATAAINKIPDQLHRVAHDEEFLGLFKLNLRDFKASISTRANSIVDAVCETVYTRTRNLNTELTQEYQQILAKITPRATTEQEMQALRDFAELVPSRVLELDAKRHKAFGLYDAIHQFQRPQSREDFNLAWSTAEWPRTIRERLAEALYDLENDAEKMLERLERQRDAFALTTKSLAERVREFAQNGVWDEQDIICEQASALDDDLQNAATKAADFNEREAIFKFPLTDYSIYEKLREDFEPYNRLWTMVSDFIAHREDWLTGSFMQLNGIKIEAMVMGWWKESFKLKKFFDRKSRMALGIASQLRDEVTAFKENLPVITQLSSKALRERHWDLMSEAVAQASYKQSEQNRNANNDSSDNKNAVNEQVNNNEQQMEEVHLVPDENLTLQFLVDVNIAQYWSSIEHICTQASKEYNIEQSLHSMQDEWNDIELELVAYKQSGTFVVRGVDDIFTLLDDHIVKVDTMLGSRYIKPIISQTRKWRSKLLYAQNVFDAWLACQKTWMYLEPIFQSPDIMRQMPKEGRRFAAVDKAWRRIMEDTKHSPRAIAVTNKEALLGKFNECNTLLDKIQKGLSDYLEVKRLVFPRFYFLSNDELLEILAQTKEPRAVQPHLGKCFEGISQVLFEGENDTLAITQMISGQGEKFPLIDIIHPVRGANKGNVEQWMLKLQQSMRLSVKDATQHAIAEYHKIVRRDFVLSHPGMVILCVTALNWTQDVTRAFEQGDLKSQLSRQKEELLDIVMLVRGKLSKLVRSNLGALCVTDVHARDVMETLVRKNITSSRDFNWIAQLRYYYEDHPDDYERYGKDPMNILPRIVNSEVLYGYEYLGNSSRLVITPLTDRCYRTMIGAVALMYGGAPAGPAGTGKTETVKDLSKAVAIQCVVFNCSDGLDYMAMGKFFKGLAASGAWACFDEFNRIELEVLSVIAEQLMTILKAKRQRLKKFLFEGVKLPLNPDCNSFITMNPGYAGRTELPDNLKALYRPCSMMVPDYAMIAEIKLYSYGFSQARKLAQKAVQVLQLCSEQLSAQKHYDYGMRAVFSILVRAGNLRQSVGDQWSEPLIVLSAITDVNLPKFTTNDIPLFRGITSDLFPNVELPTPDYGPLIPSIRNVCVRRGLQQHAPFVNAVVQLYETVMVRHGLMVVGETLSGKTMIFHSLSEAMTDISKNRKEKEAEKARARAHKKREVKKKKAANNDNILIDVENIPEFGDKSGEHNYSDNDDDGIDIMMSMETKIHTMNPKAILQGQLYGSFDENTHEWSDGILAVIYRSCARDPDMNRRHWLLFDGPVDAVWIENMNTVLDDNKKLCLTSGEILKMTDRMTMMFETQDLEEASPATVSRVGMVFVEQVRLGWQPLLISWLERVTPPPHDRISASASESTNKPSVQNKLVPTIPQHQNRLSTSTINVSIPECFNEPPLKASQKLPFDTVQEYIAYTFKWLFLPLVDFVLNSGLCFLPGTVTLMECASSALRLLRVFLHDDVVTDAIKSVAALKKPEEKLKVVEGCVILSLIWSIGAVTNADGRVKFSEYLTLLLQGADGGLLQNSTFITFAKKNPQWVRLNPGYDSQHGLIKPLDDAKLTYYDVRFDAPTRKWLPWTKGARRYDIPSGTPFAKILVPTVDMIRNMKVMTLLVRMGYNVIATGDTGTGKTAIIKSLMRSLSSEKYMLINMNYSAQTSAGMSQGIIDGKLGKRRKGIYGPPIGKKCVIFVDDVNMPKKETYGAQPPIEILRQAMSQGGWYDLNENVFSQLQDLQFIGAMGPPGGGRTQVTQRFIRHFNLINFVPYDTNSLQQIFTTILDVQLHKFSPSVRKLSPALVSCCVELYGNIRAELLPTPRKIHYTYNLRDIARVFQGLLMGAPGFIKTELGMVRLFAHETYRVFHDRLINNTDRKWFTEALKDALETHFKRNGTWSRVNTGLSMDGQVAEEIVTNKESSTPKTQTGSSLTVADDAVQLLYGNFVDPQAMEKPYQQITNYRGIMQTVEECLNDYNDFYANKMHLVLFLNALEHVCRLSRILMQPGGHALLVGVGGSGRRSLTRLAVFIQDYQIFEVAISKVYGMTEWREDLKGIFKVAGVDSKPTVFLFADTQIKLEGFVEDINNILNTGEVPNLFAKDEINEIVESLRDPAKMQGVNPDNINDVLAFFTERCRANLHVVLAFSPVGDAFRTRLLMFPSLINCCTIDWFTEWPEEALESVATRFLTKLDLENSVLKGVVKLCVTMQRSVTQLSKDFLEEQGRYYYVTPTSYLTLLQMFIKMIGSKTATLTDNKNRYDNGLKKLADTEVSVTEMQEYIRDLQPKLEVAQKETDAMLVKIEAMTIEANKVRDIVQAKENATSAHAKEAEMIKSECEKELSVALPALDNAMKALNTLKKSDITEVKSMLKPPPGVQLTMEAVCIMMGVAPDMVRDPNPPHKKTPDYWGPAKKKVLSDMKFLNRLKKYPIDAVDPNRIFKVTPYIENPDFDDKHIIRASKAAAGLCKWVHAVVTYDKVARIVAPKRAALEVAEKELLLASEQLSEVQTELQVQENKLTALGLELETTQKKKQDLEDQMNTCKVRLDRATKLLTGLGSEKIRWKQQSTALAGQLNNVLGDILLSSGVIAYLGAFTKPYRQRCTSRWTLALRQQLISCSDSFSLVSILGDPVTIREWTICRLPNDNFSIDNAIMLFKSDRFPLMIDPQGQANAWVKSLSIARHVSEGTSSPSNTNDGKNGSTLKVVKQTQTNFVRDIENAVQFGTQVLLENLPEELDPVLESVLLKSIVKTGGVETIKVGDSLVEYDANFYLYLTTKLRNPHYPPETCVKVNLLNFVATEEGLEDQMLGIVVKEEKPELEQKREALVLEDAANKKKLAEIESTILHMLANSKGNILDDENLINKLASSKVTSNHIQQQVERAVKTNATIMQTRKAYQPVAFRVSRLFFCIADLANIDPMYQYSLDFYVGLFRLAIARAEVFTDDIGMRCTALKNTFLWILYENVCRSLFEKDKLLFSFLLCTKIQQTEKGLQFEKLRYLLQGSTAMTVSKVNPSGRKAWLSDTAWKNIVGLAETFPEFRDILPVFASRLTQFQELVKSTDPMPILESIIEDTFGKPSKGAHTKSGSPVMDAEIYDNVWQDPFLHLMLLRCLREDKVVPAVQNYIAAKMGRRFIISPPMDLTTCYEDSSCCIPIVFVLSMGSAPMEMLLQIAEEKNMGGKKLFSVSLGQGQGPIAAAGIQEAVDKGTWVCLQNCHLSASWMPTLEAICEGITPDTTHPAFRLWLTSMPDKVFPVSILQNAVKITVEPPMGMRANLQGNYLNQTDEWFDNNAQPETLRKMTYALSFFHAMVRERIKFGPLGWNIPYDFSEMDLRISLDQLAIFLDESESPDQVPYETLRYLVGECNYGGRVTDDKDHRFIQTLIADFYHPDVVSQANFSFSESGQYTVPADLSVEGTLSHIRALPLNEEPEVFELHPNANISSSLSKTRGLLGSALSLQATSGAGAGSGWEESVTKLCEAISNRIPEPYDIGKVQIDYPIVYNESMNTVLIQELMRFNHLGQKIKHSLRDMQRSICGELVMSQELEELGLSMFNGQVPAMWHKVAYPSLKDLSSWVNDLVLRFQFIDSWIRDGAPGVYWISGFFFTQAFLTGTRQNFARKYTIPIDEVKWSFSTFSRARSNEVREHDRRAPDGAYINGFFLEGAGWDDEHRALTESKPKVLYTAMPTMWMLPTTAEFCEKAANKKWTDREVEGSSVEACVASDRREMQRQRLSVYQCPVYKTSERRGMLSTTGHSTNFVVMFDIPKQKGDKAKHWIKRGTAMLTQLD